MNRPPDANGLPNPQIDVLNAASSLKPPGGFVINPAEIEVLRKEKPGLLNQLTTLFFQVTDKTLDGLKTAIDSGDAKSVASGAHLIKGSAGNFGADRLMAACEALEQAGQRKDRGEFQKLLDAIQVEYQSVSDALRGCKDFVTGFEAMKIIVAEDDPVTRERLCNTLFVLGHDVQAFPNGKLAWDAFQAGGTRVVISDWMMPEMDGLEFCSAIRKADEKDYVYFILVTALRTNGTDYDRAVKAGVDDFLAKPVDLGDIWRRLFVAQRIINYTVQIRQLKNLIPICMYCKKIRNDSDYWQGIENYIHEHTGSDFSHGICPECYARYAEEEAESL